MKKSLNFMVSDGLSDMSDRMQSAQANFDEDATIPDVTMEEISGEEITLRDGSPLQGPNCFN